MAYTKQTWADGALGGTPITAARLAHMEQGIFDGNTATAVQWSHQLRVTDTGTRALGYNGADLGVIAPAGLALERVHVRFRSSDASGATTIQLRRNGATTDMPLISVAAPGLMQTWAATPITLAQNDALTAEITALGGTPGTGLLIIYSGTYL
ncbi:hypothetical protein [Nocardia sp. NPDC052566]|uniref:hypothetical protein n=1 Tax=Nocardia sp. NPDC052566 TaxID=3364330 RepID=UPI0037C74D2C